MSIEPSNTGQDALAEIRQAVDWYNQALQRDKEQVARFNKLPHGAGGMSNLQSITQHFKERVYRHVPALLARYDALEEENLRLKRELDKCRQ